MTGRRAGGQHNARTTPVIRHCIGIDLGTSGLRAAVLDATGAPAAQLQEAIPAAQRRGDRSEQDPELWWQAVRRLLQRLAHAIPRAPVAIAVDGTSGTLLAVDAGGRPLGPALMYDDARARVQAETLRRIAPQASAAHGISTSAARLLWLRDQGRLANVARVLHQAEWIAGRLLGRFDHGDENNALKLGYDPVQRCWPTWWCRELGPLVRLLPRIVPAGTVLGPIAAEVADDTGLHPQSRIVAGTTDSIAGFLATGVRDPGVGVTSLGSTLVLKQLSEQPLFDPAAGIYSHRILGHWLVGGASNTGGAVLARYFTAERIESLSHAIDPEQASGLDYYPLLRPGERFPISDPHLRPRLNPRPPDDRAFLHGLLEGIAQIEAAGYARLARIGAPPVTAIVSVGGGAANPQWRALRARICGVPVYPAEYEAAAHGAALLAQQGVGSETA